MKKVIIYIFLVFSILSFSNTFNENEDERTIIAKQGLNKEYEGGKGFSFRTEPKIVTIKKQVDSLDEISGLLENRLKNINDKSIAGYSNIMGDNFGNR